MSGGVAPAPCFAAALGVSRDVEHRYYSHVETEAYVGDCYPMIPRTAVHLIDFTEVF